MVENQNEDVSPAPHRGADVNLANRNLGRFGDGTPSQFGEYFYECGQCGKPEGGVKFTKK